MSADRELLANIRRAQIIVAEEVVIAGIPEALKARMDEAQRQHVAKGGCPGCGSQILAVHAGGCPVGADDLY